LRSPSYDGCVVSPEVANRSDIDTPIGSMPLLPQLTNRKETNLFRATDGNHSQAAR